MSVFGAFAFTLAGAVIISGFVALTLSPMMSARLLKPHSMDNRYMDFLNRFFNRLTQGYQKILRQILKIRLLVIVATIGIAFAGYFLFTHFTKAFTPPQDIGFVVTVVNTPAGTNAEYARDQIEYATQLINQFSAVKTTISFASVDAGGFNGIIAGLKPYKERTLSAQKLADSINAKAQQNPKLNNANTFAPSFGGSMQHQLQFYLMSSGTYMDLYRVSQDLVEKLMASYKGLINVNSDMQFNSQQYELNVNRELAGNLQVDVRSIDNTLADLLGGMAVSTFDIGGKSYDVYIQAADNYLHDTRSLNQFFVKNSQGNLISLSNLVGIKPVLTQNNLTHYDRLRSTLISAQLAPKHSLGEAVDYLNKNLPKLLPGDVKYAFVDAAKQLQDSSNSTGMIFLLAIVFIYLVLSAQFESFLDPLIILLAVPFSIVGALALLKLFNGSINIYTSIGLVTLIGLIAKHGILITQFANKLQEEGHNAVDALIVAASIRLRPILMTTAAMIVGALPLIVASGASAISRREIGIVITSGLFFGTFFSLVLVPVSYSYIAQFKKWLRKFRREELNTEMVS